MRRGYGQFCPVAKGAEVLAERWTPLVVRELLEGSTRFNDLHRGVPLMSRSMLSLRLKQLEDVGVVTRKGEGQATEYHLTEQGREFAPIIHMLGEWGQRWYRTNFADNELDVSLLMWDIHRKVHPEYFPPGRTTVQFDFSGVPSGRTRWWLVSATSEVDVCPIDPGFEVDLHVTTHVRTLTRIWLGDLTYRNALTKGDIKLYGPRSLMRHFEQWLGRSTLADVKDARRNVPAEVVS
jgi:DNA-binding HxlR family transcriptional regulator